MLDHTLTTIITAGHRALAHGRHDVAATYARTVLAREPGHPEALLLGLAVDLSRAADEPQPAAAHPGCRGSIDLRPLPYVRGVDLMDGGVVAAGRSTP